MLHCYRLAKYYHCDPDVFIGKTVTALLAHLTWTDRLIESMETPETG